MNLSTYVSQHPGISVIAYQDSAQSDIECVPCVRIMSASELNDIIKREHPSFGKPMFSVSVSDGAETFKASIERMYAMTSLLASEHGGLQFVAISRRQRKTRGFEHIDIVPVIEHNGWYRRLVVSSSQTPVVPISQFARACMDAVDDGKIAMKASVCTQLKALNLMVTVNGVTAPLRLDIALALLKRGRKLPVDAYGETVVGALCAIVNNKPVWRIAYEYPDKNGKVLAQDLANIDHVYPQSKGGQTRLCNLQMMRTHDNSIKSDAIVPDVDGEPLVSLLVIDKLDAGVRGAHERGTLDDVTFERWGRLCALETSECHAVMAQGSTSKTLDDVAGIVSFV